MHRIMELTSVSATVLREIFLVRAAKRHYSLRAFAADLGISHTYLSLILNDKKRLPLATLKSFADKLGIDEQKVWKLDQIDAGGASPKKLRQFSRLEIDKFRLMSRWYYVAILDLIEVEDFIFNTANVARYFAIDTDETREALAALKRLGLLKVIAGKWMKVERRLSIIMPTSLEAIRAYHRQMIAKATDELEKTSSADFKLRDITGMTMPINPSRIPGAKRRIARFRRSLEAYLTHGKCTEVYQFNVQLFTLRAGGKSK